MQHRRLRVILYFLQRANLAFLQIFKNLYLRNGLSTSFAVWAKKRQEIFLIWIFILLWWFHSLSYNNNSILTLRLFSVYCISLQMDRCCVNKNQSKWPSIEFWMYSSLIDLGKMTSCGVTAIFIYELYFQKLSSKVAKSC